MLILLNKTSQLVDCEVLLFLMNLKAIKSTTEKLLISVRVYGLHPVFSNLHLEECLYNEKVNNDPKDDYHFFSMMC